jgi:uncharacterized protein (DUF58 family)
MMTLFSYSNWKPVTNYAKMLRFVGDKKTKDSVIFLLSDFIGLHDEVFLRSLARSSELIAVRCLDPLERNVPSVGLVTLQDRETHQYIELNARSSQCAKISFALQERLLAQNGLFARYGIDVFEATAKEDLVKDLIRFFRKRAN